MIIAALLFLLLLAIAGIASGNGWSNVLSPVRNELVFNGRNRDYGAYVIRREHHRVMLIAFTVAVAMAGSMLAVPRLFTSAVDGTPIPLPPPDDRIIHILPDRAAPPTPPVAPPKPPANPDQMSVPVAVDSVHVVPTDTIPHTPDPSPDPGPSGPMSVGPGSPGPGGTDPGADRDTTIREGWEADSPPEYPGGLDALHADLRAIIRYPQADIDLRREGKVYVSFVVTEEGALSQVEVGRGVSPTMDAEALRAVRQLKKRWKPGRFKGGDVPVRYSLPIHFRLAR